MNRTHLEYLASDAWAQRLTTDLIPWIERVATLGDDVLEIGPGPGLTTDILRSRAAHVTAVEIDAAMIDWPSPARKNNLRPSRDHACSSSVPEVDTCHLASAFGNGRT